MKTTKNEFASITFIRYKLGASLAIALFLPSIALCHNDHDFDTDARKKVSSSYAVGLYIPTVGGGSTAKAGYDFWSSFRYPVGTFDLRSTYRTQTYSLTDPTGSEQIFSLNGQGYDALYRLNAFYFGPGVNFVSNSANTWFFPFSHPWKSAFTLTAGFDITNRFFVEAMWQGFGQDPYRGVELSTGYRF